MKTVAIVQARMGSTRFPRKVMQPILGVPMIEILLERLARAKLIGKIIVATSTGPRNEPLADHVRKLGYEVYRGSEDDVLDRYYQAAAAAGAGAVVRITGDCPLIDPEVVDSVIAARARENVDYASNVCPPTFPNGLDTEVFCFSALETAWREAREPREREHVTPYLRESSRFSRFNVVNAEDRSQARWTVDEPEDLEVVREVFAHFQPSHTFGWREVLKLWQTQPQLFAANRHIAAGEGAILGTGEKLWKRAKRIIPGGGMLLSKRAEMFLPDRWPAYFSKAKGCKVWDLDGNEFVDMSLMGAGSNTLGYGHPEVDEAVMKAVSAGNMSTLNGPEEVYLAEKLVELHPWADMVCLAQPGGEAEAISIRIARAASGRDKVAICGYHRRHEGDLAASPGDEKNLAGRPLPFNYNRLDELEALTAAHDIGVIKMEISRSHGLEAGFLEGARERGIVLIFDECTSGFRQTYGGLHKLYGVEPDMAIFGKALGNGYAITGVIGRREIMEAAQTAFISSTVWTGRIGPSAALKTLEVMERVQSWETITRTGRDITARWLKLAQKHGLTITTSGLPALTGFSFSGPKALAYKTLITQEMLAKSYLAATAVYVCTEHTPDVVDAYFEALDPVFGLIRECEDGRDVMSLLKGPVCHNGFKRRVGQST